MTTTLTNHESPRGARLERKMSKINMLAMTFAILNTWIALAGVMGTVLSWRICCGCLRLHFLCVMQRLHDCKFRGACIYMADSWGPVPLRIHARQWKMEEDLVVFNVGWLSIVGWLTMVTTAAYFAAFFITAAIIVATDGTYESAPWKVYLMFGAIIVFTTITNLYGNKIMYQCITGIMLRTDATYVFAGFSNTTGWPSGISWILGMLQSVLSLIGSDAATHMSEEMPRPTLDTPKAMVYSIVVGGITGLGFILVVLFCSNGLQTVLATATGLPITALVHQSTGSATAASILTLMLAI
ncbi:uncharacterized protein RAG0_05572 [Rhynchosporium agropyri]|uniref:Amino acid transporter transmembrane domain-containing protein n=1 Tax=Rhynchosporium agropyri TaxID=914238 RepID=A0A1E1KDR2_9HELO|nr:uncharacterized protein RAG0_05572 [Rhynchosporium agropyri]